MPDQDISLVLEKLATRVIPPSDATEIPSHIGNIPDGGGEGLPPPRPCPPRCIFLPVGEPPPSGCAADNNAVIPPCIVSTTLSACVSECPFGHVPCNE